jgi:hypothetical protein
MGLPENKACLQEPHVDSSLTRSAGTRLFFWQWGQRLVMVDMATGSDKYDAVHSRGLYTLGRSIKEQI